VSEILHRLNRQMFGYTAANKFATLFYGVYDDADQTLTYCNAGHNPPFYIDGEEVKELKTGGTVIGIFNDSSYEQETIRMKAGGVLVAYTDGIVESLNEKGEEFGAQRIIQLSLQYRHLDAEKIKKIIVERVLAWTSSEERGDDMTLIVAKVPQQGASAAGDENIA
jgi:sigma-B regulation protein RsbU (phosphoserine phosphatase)